MAWREPFLWTNMAQDLSSTKRYLIPLFWVRRDNCQAYMIQHPNLLFDKELWYFSERSFQTTTKVVCMVLFWFFSCCLFFFFFNFLCGCLFCFISFPWVQTKINVKASLPSTEISVLTNFGGEKKYNEAFQSVYF